MTFDELVRALMRRPLNRERYAKTARHLRSTEDLDRILALLPEHERGQFRDIVAPLLARKGVA